MTIIPPLRYTAFSMKIFRIFFFSASLLLLQACDNSMWNSPYPAAQNAKNILYAAFTERPKHLDPVQSYSENEAVFTAQIYMPPLQYHYLRRPYELIPFGATELPRAQFFDVDNKRLPDNADAKNIAYSLYDIHIRPGIYYQPHPAFALDQQGKPLNQNLSEKDLKNIFELR